MRQATAEEARALTLYTEAQVLNAARCAGLSEEQWLRLKAYLPVPAGVSGSANQTFSQAHADATAKAFEIADQAMYEQLESEGVLSSADVGRIGLADDVGLEVPTLALAGRAIRDAVAWLQPRGYVSIASDAHGEYVLVLRVPGETDVDEAEVPA
jgi:hypothetical protein